MRTREEIINDYIEVLQKGERPLIQILETLLDIRDLLNKDNLNKDE